MIPGIPPTWFTQDPDGNWVVVDRRLTEFWYEVARARRRSPAAPRGVRVTQAPMIPLPPARSGGVPVRPPGGTATLGATTCPQAGPQPGPVPALERRVDAGSSAAAQCHPRHQRKTSAAQVGAPPTETRSTGGCDARAVGWNHNMKWHHHSRCR